MHYNISITEDIACITLEGNLNALDFIFMLQSKEYKDMIKQYKKIIMDYTKITGSTLTEQDGVPLSMLIKKDLEHLGKITFVISVNENKQKLMEKITSSIFSDSHIDLFVTDAKTKALEILHSI
jgi:hypothetical protein